MVAWLDADGMDGWHFTDEVHRYSAGMEPATIVTVGFIVQETEDYLTIAQSIAADGFGNIMRIPNQMVQKVTTLA
jgi:hypothetical protein